MHSTTELRERYLRVRQVSLELNQKLVKRLSKDDIERGATETGFMRGGTVVLGNMDESNILFDYCIYNVYRDGRNAVERLMEECPPTEGSEERFVLQAKRRAWYSIFGINKVVAGVGVEADDIFRETRHLIADVGMSRGECVGGLIATRVIPLGECVMTGGAGLPLAGSDKERAAFAAAVRRVCFEQNIVSFKQLTAEQEKELTRVIIRAALAAGASSFIRYETAKPAARLRRREREPAVLGAPRRVGRNEPCPCGSGRKFKVCCGGNR